MTTNPFFVPTQYGAADAASLVNVKYTWGGSTKADVGEMINAFNAAISAKADGIAVCVVDKGAFEAPIKRALEGDPGARLQRRRSAGRRESADGVHRPGALRVGLLHGPADRELVPKGDVALFIATPGALNIQPRIDGAMAAIKQSGKPINPKIVATDADLSKELTAIDSYYLGHKNLAGMFAVDAGDTQGVGQIIQKHSLREGDRRRVRPAARHAQADRPGVPELHDRSTAVPAGVLPRAPALPLQAVRRPGGPLGHEHGPAVRDQGERQAVPHDEDAVRGLLEAQKYPVS